MLAWPHLVRPGNRLVVSRHTCGSCCLCLPPPHAPGLFVFLLIWLFFHVVFRQTACFFPSSRQPLGDRQQGKEVGAEPRSPSRPGLAEAKAAWRMVLPAKPGWHLPRCAHLAWGPAKGIWAPHPGRPPWAALACSAGFIPASPVLSESLDAGSSLGLTLPPSQAPVSARESAAHPVPGQHGWRERDHRPSL